MAILYTEAPPSYREARLPLELEREIFELAAHEDPKTAYALLLVAKKVHIWIESSLYRVVVKAFHNGVFPSSPFIQKFEDAFHQGVLSPPEVKRQAFYVQHALISRGDALPLLTMCPNIVDLAIWCSIDSHKIEISTMLPLIPIQKLSIRPTYLLKENPDYFRDTTLARSLTHFDMVCVDGPFWADGWKFLSCLPRLTHLAVDGTNVYPTIEGVLRESETITLVVRCPGTVCAPGDKNEDTEYEKRYGEDSRLVFCKYPENPLNCWEGGANGGQDMWNMAESLQQVKKNRIRRLRREACQSRG
ncbi:hypothetical protein CPB83DRAFT_862755 [Crepidotus variabilis]|uniref:Uncharacterized protein n=1 Tax=Crepidotus variabilis TaxID=179855 RepID=A0A9P6E6K6_9AGAR|nr:hypothetical protein CPB83DRAFT_862755 [Crepidotus variabilis]